MDANSMTTPPPLLDPLELIDDLLAYRSAGTRGARLTICTRAAAALEALAAENGELKNIIAGHITFAETRIQDGIELGAAVWRMALEDIVSEARTTLNGAPQP